MDGEAECSQGEKKRSYTDIMMDEEELRGPESNFEVCGTKTLYMVDSGAVLVVSESEAQMIYSRSSTVTNNAFNIICWYMLFIHWHQYCSLFSCKFRGEHLNS